MLREKTTLRDARRREQGSALLIAVMMLVLMAALGFAALDTATRDRQTAGFQSLQRLALYAAEAGAVTALTQVQEQDERGDKPTVTPTDLGDATIYAQYSDRPRYAADPDAAFAITWVTDGGAADGMSVGTDAQFVASLWRIQVLGTAGSGVEARIDVVGKKVLAGSGPTSY